MWHWPISPTSSAPRPTSSTKPTFGIAPAATAAPYAGAGDTEVVYAGKSLLTTAVARWAREEGLGIDVCSTGELATALSGGLDPARIVVHGNAKSPEELREAVRVGVGRVVVDSRSEERRVG